MNKSEKQVAAASLRDEATVIRQTRENYKEARANIEEKLKVLAEREQTQSVIWQRQYQQALKEQLDTAIDVLSSKNYSNIRQYLEGEYENGFIGTMYSLQKQGIPLVMPIDQKRVVKMVETTAQDIKLSKRLYGNTTKLKNAIRREVSIGFASGESYQTIASRIQTNLLDRDFNKAIRIARTEGGRVSNASRFDAATEAKKSGADIVKQWDSTLDNRTRTAHRELDGQVRELEDDFEAEGQKAKHPHGFGVPWMDVNCRCVVLQRARWAVEGEGFDDYTKYSRFEDFERDKWLDGSLDDMVSKRGGGIIDLSDSRNFDDFKDRYKKAANNITAQNAARAIGVDVMGAANEIFETPKTLSNYEQNIQWAKESMIDNFEGYRGLPKEYWEPFDKYLANVPKYERQLSNALKKFDFASNTDSKAIESILRDGRYKSYMETGKTKGDGSTALRKGAAENLFGLWDKIDEMEPGDFEKYGYLGKAKRAEDLYGNCRVVYDKDRMWDRTTVTVGDSLQGYHGGNAPTPSKVSDPSIVSYSKDPFTPDNPAWNETIGKATDRMFDSIEQNGYFQGATNSQDYVELQFHGNVTLGDIAYIEVPDTAENLDAILKLAKEKGVEVRVIKKRKK